MYIKENGDFMLLRFTFKNFKSFCDEAVLDLTASSITEHKDSLITVNNIDILPIAAIFGANGSGKSNCIEALVAMGTEVYGYKSKEGRESIITPYYFDDEYRNSPSEFEVCVYSYELNKEFRYGFCRTNKEVLEEWLFMKTFSKTPSVKEKCVFYRKKGSKLESELTNQNELKEINFVSSVTSNDELIVTNIGKRDKCKYSYIYYWFADHIIFMNFSNFNESQGYKNQNFLELLFEEEEWLSLVEDMIKLVDPAIIGLKVEKEVDSNMSDYYVIYSKHKKNDNTDIKVPFSTESCGTKKMLYLSLNLVFSLKFGRPCFIDELDSKLHPLLLRYIVQMYTDKSKNKGGGQLIFSSHNLICLDSSDLRRDEIWFVEKNNQKSTMFSLYDFKEETIRKDLDFGKHYLNGRFGAVPFNDEG